MLNITKELHTDIIHEFKRLQLHAKVVIIDELAYVRISQNEAPITFSHNAISLLSILQMYEPKSTSAAIL